MSGKYPYVAILPQADFLDVLAQEAKKFPTFELLMQATEQPGVRLVHIDGVWTCPIGGAESLRQTLDAIEVSRESLGPFDEPATAGLLSRPVRS